MSCGCDPKMEIMRLRMKTTLIYTDLESRAFSVVTYQGVNVDTWERSNTSNSTIDDDVECSKSRWD